MKRLLFLLTAVAIIPACGGSGGGGLPAPTVVTEFGGAVIVDDTPGTATFKSLGGKGSVGAGGNGGICRVAGLSGSDTQIRKTGAIDTTFIMPSATPPLGSNPLTISSDTTLDLGGGALTAGVTTVLGDNATTTATGLWVKPGVTLTLGPNWDADNADLDDNVTTGMDQCRIAFQLGVLIEGNIRVLTRIGSPDSAHFFIFGGDVVIRSTATVVTSGADSAPGADGAKAGNIHFEAWGTLINEAPLTALGGSGDNGGTGGTCWLLSDYYSAFNSGTVTLVGGTGNDGVGGAGGGFRFEAAAAYSGINGDLAGGGGYNTGNATTKGGNGTLGGGVGGNIDFYSDSGDGPFVNSGATLESTGGDATVDGNGGNSGACQLTSMGGIARITGRLIARGGKGAGATGIGGNGGYIEASANLVATQAFNGGNFVGASIDSSGGDGAVGGNGGQSNVWNNSNYGGFFVRPGMDPTVVVGLQSFDSSGGDGATKGGNGGIVYLYNYASYDPGGVPHTGSLTNEVPGTVRGGAGGGGNGGNGGWCYVASFANNIQDSFGPSHDRVFINRGAMDATGGAGSLNGGVGGYIEISDDFRVENYAPLVTKGGQGGAGPGGSGNVINVWGDGVVINEAALTADGGDSLGDSGGNGSQIFVQGYQASHKGVIRSHGGKGTPNVGGNGGSVEIGSWNGMTLSSVQGSLEVPGGLGVPPGVPGIVTIDGLRVTLTGGVITY